MLLLLALMGKPSVSISASGVVSWCGCRRLRWATMVLLLLSSSPVLEGTTFRLTRCERRGFIVRLPAAALGDNGAAAGTDGEPSVSISASDVVSCAAAACVSIRRAMLLLLALMGKPSVSISASDVPVAAAGACVSIGR